MSTKLFSLVFCSAVLWLAAACDANPPATTLRLSPISTNAGEPATVPQTSVPAAPSTSTTEISATETLAVVDLFQRLPRMNEETLKLSVAIAPATCYAPGSMLQTVVSYQNITANLLTLVDYRLLDTHVLFGARAQLFPILSSASGELVVTPYDLMRLDKFGSAQSPARDLAPNATFDVSVIYPIPEEQIERDEHGRDRTIPLKPGEYLLRFVYVSAAGRQVWSGSTSSNTIKLCIGS